MYIIDAFSRLGIKVVSFSVELYGYGLNIDLLAGVYDDIKAKKAEPIAWSLRGIPEIGFYKALHGFLKRWPKTISESKVALGTFYIGIDKHLKTKGVRPDNAYRFVEKLYASNLPQEMVVNYNFDKATVHALQTEVKQYTEEIQKLNTEFAAMKLQMENTKRDLKCTQQAQRDALSKLKSNHSQMTRSKTSEMEKQHQYTLCDILSLEDELQAVKAENLEMSQIIESIRNELSAMTTGDLPIAVDSKSNFVIETMTGGKQYSAAIRKLYYTLLADQVPPAKISTIIMSVLKCFFPSVNTEELQLPKERCAGYMRTEELKIVNTAHIATVVHERIAHGKLLHLNVDETTLAQKKLGGAAISNMVLPVNELSDGTAKTTVEDVSKELERLREMANSLKLPHANSINWTIFSSITSDSASSQKRCAKLVQNNQDVDRKKYGQAGPEALDIVENFCVMHLGCNLRKAFLSGIKTIAGSGAREYSSVDVMVHEFCKLFGRYGVPEYGCGAKNFLIFCK